MSERDAVTALVPLFNAEQTIARALHSVIDQVDRVIVYDDGSSDDSCIVVESLALPGLELIEGDNNAGIGVARQRLLEACDTPCAVWLDADDACLPGRVQHLQAVIAAGFDWAFDAAVLVDPASDKEIRPLPIDPRLLQDDGILWEFARNYIPSLGWAMVKTAAARAIGFDTSFRQAEDYDHLLRAILAGYRIGFCEHIGYRYYDSPVSASRNLALQNSWSELALSRLDRTRLEQRLFTSQLPPADQDRILAYFLARRKDWPALFEFTRSPTPSDWELAFLHGVACFHAMRFVEAIQAFDRSLAIRETACGFNNRGVSRIRSGDAAGSEDFDAALQLLPHYLDAQRNQQGEELVLTLYPLREQPIRDSYV